MVRTGFPKQDNGYAYAGTDIAKLRHRMKGYSVIWPKENFYEGTIPTDGQVFDLIEFSYEFIAEAQDPSLHSYMSHSHYKYNRDSGRDKFANDVNRIFERNGIAFELKDGEIMRIAPAMLQESLADAVFKTGDAILDNLLEVSRQKIMNCALEVRREALEKIWDAWERLKTIGAYIFLPRPKSCTVSLAPGAGRRLTQRWEDLLAWPADICASSSRTVTTLIHRNRKKWI